jgi:hypothetical protein
LSTPWAGESNDGAYVYHHSRHILSKKYTEFNDFLIWQGSTDQGLRFVKVLPAENRPGKKVDSHLVIWPPDGRSQSPGELQQSIVILHTEFTEYGKAFFSGTSPPQIDT